MFNLEKSIAEWRQQMTEGGVDTPLPLDQLENHLREEIGNLMSAGMPEAQAFQLAVSRLGSPGPLQTEFTRTMRASRGPMTIGSLLLGGMIIALAAGLLRDLLAERLNFLLFAHIFSVTAGYGAAFLAGCFGVYYVCYQSFHPLSPERQHSLRQAVFLFNNVAAGLVFAGLILGMLWSKQNLGHYLGRGPREIGMLCASAWLTSLWLTQRFGRISEHASMLMGIGGNIIVSVAWFGAVIMTSHSGMNSYQMGIIYWPLAIFLGLHLFFLGMGVAPARATAQS